MSICGNMVGSYSQIGKTFIIQDENGNELTGVATANEVVFTATDNDVREGSVYASDAGVSTGTKVIPSYHTTEGFKVITEGLNCIMTIPNYDYTRLQAIFCPFNTNVDDSVAAEKVVINDCVYPVNSTIAESNVTVDIENGRINFGVTNTSTKPLLIRYFTYKEIY